MKSLLKLALVLLFPLSVMAQNSVFENTEATAGSIRNLSQFASTEIDAVVYNPAGLAFSDKAFQISLGGIVGYQLVENKPFNINSDGNAVYDLPHKSTMLRLTPSLQTYYKWKRLTVSASFANEGGGGFWRDSYGNAIMDSYIHSVEDDLHLDIIQTQLQESHFLINDDDILRIYSSDFVSKVHNYCGRLGITYKFANHFSAYIGGKVNWVQYTDNSDFNLYIQRPSTSERWLLADYLRSTQGLVTNSSVDSIYNKIEKLQKAGNSNGKGVSLTYAPVVGINYNNNNINIGLKYEMRTSIHGDKANMTFPNDFSVGASYSFFNKKLDLSVGADFKWGFYSDANSVIHVFNVSGSNLFYNICVGANYHFNMLNKNFIASASSYFGETFFSVRNTGSYFDVIERIAASPARFSLGLQCCLNNDFKFDIGFSFNPIYGNTEVFNVTSNFINQEILTESHCEYYYMPRIAGGIGVTYSY